MIYNIKTDTYKHRAYCWRGNSNDLQATFTKSIKHIQLEDAIKQFNNTCNICGSKETNKLYT